ncbi:selenide, water dikinase SelD [bacterium]|nr:selenide, water dikinase SelD [bacterium]
MTDDVRLTALSQAGGCARKLAAGDLVQVLRQLPSAAHPWVAPDVGAMEDAALLTPPGSGALVFTVDFITPLVDDPETFGAVAAANAISDVYAMGGEPQAALAVCAFPDDRLPLSVLERIFRGGRDKAAEAGCAIAGGHTIRGPELTYGLCVVGSVDPARVMTQTRARPGDALVLTKPLGFGIATQAIKKQMLAAADLAEVTRLMTTLNKTAKDAALAAGARAATDVTGFGLLGHLRNLLLGSGVAARLRASQVPLLPFARDLARAGVVPGGTRTNLAAATAHCEWAADVDEVDRLMLADAQTSGGLLIAVAAERAAALAADLQARGAPAGAVIGEVIDGIPGHVECGA